MEISKQTHFEIWGCNLQNNKNIGTKIAIKSFKFCATFSTIDTLKK